MTQPFIVVGCPVKNRAWAVARWWEGVRAQTVTPDAMHLLINDSTDDTSKLLNALARKQRYTGSFLDDPASYHVDNLQTGDRGYDRISPRYSTSHLSMLRNRWLAYIRHRWPYVTHVWSCDSDVVPDADVLGRLLALCQPVASALVRNSTAPVWNFALSPTTRTGGEADAVATGKPFRVQMTGACTLYRQDALDAGVEWSPHENGEDIGLALTAEKLGVAMWVDPGARTSHIQRDGTVWR